MNLKSLNLFSKFSLIFLVATVFVFPEVAFATDVFTWTAQTGSGSRSWVGVTMSSDGTKLAAAATNGNIYTSTNSGVDWIDRPPAAGAQVWGGITGSSDGVKIFASYSNNESGMSAVYFSTNSGTNWASTTEFLVDGSAGRIVASSDGSHLAVTDGLAYTSADSGATWNVQNAVPFASQGGLAISSDGLKLAVTGSLVDIYTSTNGYTSSNSLGDGTWTDQTGSGARAWRGVTMSSDGTKLAAVVNNGTVYTSTNSGVNWTSQTGSGSRTWKAISSSADGTVIAAVVTTGSIYISTDSGVTWNAEVLPGSKPWNSVVVSPDGTKIAASATGSNNIWTGSRVADSTAPTVSMTAPLTGATVHGSSVSLTADASDNTGVSGVQFKLDTNTNIGSEDTTSTYGVSWDSTAVSDGSHTLHAVARDAAGNYATSTITVTVDNTAPIISSIAANAITASGATIAWITNESATSQVYYGPTNLYGNSTLLDTSTVTSHSVTLSGLMSGISQHYIVVSKDGAGNTSTSTDQIFNTSASSGGSFGGSSFGSQNTVNTSFTLPFQTPSPTPAVLPLSTCLPGELFNTQTGMKCSGVIIPVVFLFTKNLQVGATDAEVKLLQQYLNAHGFIVTQAGPGSAGNETITFGALTKAALIKFQAAHGIPATGYFGPMTKAYINSHP